VNFTASGKKDEIFEMNDVLWKKIKWIVHHVLKMQEYPCCKNNIT